MDRSPPNDQISARRSTTPPRACSGLIYPAVPNIIPASVAHIVNVGEFGTVGAAVRSTFLASPKSRTFTTPDQFALELCEGIL